MELLWKRDAKQRLKSKANEIRLNKLKVKREISQIVQNF